MGGLSNVLGQGKLWRYVIGKDFIKDQKTDSSEEGERERGGEGRGGEERGGERRGRRYIGYAWYDKNQSTVPKTESVVKRRGACMPVRQGSRRVWDHPTHQMHTVHPTHLSSFRVA